MENHDNQYERKARYNPDRQTYVDESGNYVYCIWDEEKHDYRQEVYLVGEGGISPELRTALDEMDAEEERRLDADDHHRDKEFDDKKDAYAKDTTGKITDPMELLIEHRQRSFQEALKEDPRIGQLLRAMEQLTPEQVDLVYAVYGEMSFGADIAREKGVSRQAIHNRLKKIHARLAKLMDEG